MTELDDMLNSLNELHATEMELAAIWITEPVPVINGVRKARFEAGDFIRWADGAVNDGTATHKILGCFGNVSSSVLKFTAINLQNSQIEILKVK